MITELEFKSLASQGYNRIPLMAEAFADPAFHAELGLTNEAATAAARTREAMPFFDSGKFGTLIRNPTMRDNLLLHLKAAGL